MSTFRITDAGRVARVTLDRPPLNVIDLEYARSLAASLEEVQRLSGLCAVVLEARGKAFCAGVDVRDHLPDRGAEMLHEFHRVCRLLLEVEVPVIAAVQGAALGGGCELTLACDLVIAAASAKFGQPEIRLGVFPPFASVALPRVVPARVASDMLLTGRTLSADEALRVGLASRVAPDTEFGAALDGLVAELVALSPASLKLAKRAIGFARVSVDPAEIEAAERFYIERLMHTPDAIEGLKAFMEKRAPVWGAAKGV